MSLIYIHFADGISAAGMTVAEAMETFYAGKQPFSIPSHFAFKDLKLGVVPRLPVEPGESRATALLKSICARLPKIPEDTMLFLATTVGTIDILEKAPQTDAPDCTGILLQQAKQLTQCTHAILVAAACASGQTATAMAMRALRAKQCTHALVIGLDMTSEFVTGGFASLRAYSTTIARPYDKDRDGLMLGEGVGTLLLSQTSENALGTLIEAGESCDASHITAPDLTGNSLAALIKKVLSSSKLQADDVAGVIGHGTGTPFNDQSELAALTQVFPEGRPLISIKGNTGHTLGATGVLQIVYGLEFLKRKQMPPQAGLSTPAEGAEHFVSQQIRQLHSDILLSLNVGFGGLNSAVLLKSSSSHPQNDTQQTSLSPVTIQTVSKATIDFTTHTATINNNGKSFNFETLADLKQQICDDANLIQGDLADFRRAAENVRAAQLGCILCASGCADQWSASNTALFGINGDGCAANNRAFWDDFTKHDHENGKASLFVPTLPSIPVCEAAITLGIRGPVRYVKTANDTDLQNELRNTFAADSSLHQIMLAELTSTKATFTLIAHL